MSAGHAIVFVPIRNVPEKSIIIELYDRVYAAIPMILPHEREISYDVFLKRARELFSDQTSREDAQWFINNQQDISALIDDEAICLIFPDWREREQENFQSLGFLYFFQGYLNIGYRERYQMFPNTMWVVYRLI